MYLCRRLGRGDDGCLTALQLKGARLSVHRVLSQIHVAGHCCRDPTEGQSEREKYGDKKEVKRRGERRERTFKEKRRRMN